MVTDEVDASMLELLKESFDLVKIVNLIDSQVSGVWKVWAEF